MNKEDIVMAWFIQRGIEGAKTVLNLAEDRTQQMLDAKGERAPVVFPDTAYYLPLAYGLLGEEAAKVGDLSSILIAAKTFLEEKTPQDVDRALRAGMAALLCAEIIAAIRYLNNEEPQQDCTGFFTDSILRSLGLKLAGGKIPGFALLMGAAPDKASAAELVRDFQKKNILTFVGGKSNEVSLIDQLKEAEVEMGWEHSLVPYGRDVVSAIFPIHWAIRLALTFGAVQKGDRENLLRYTRERVPAAVVKLGELTPEEVAAVWGAINIGFPAVVNADIAKIELPGICKYEALAGEPDIRKLSEAALQIRGIKVHVSKIQLPVPYSAAFEGERVRKEDMFVQFGGNYSASFEFVTSRDVDEIEDGKIETKGKEITGMGEGEAYPLALWVEVAGRKWEKDFEPVLERQIHSYLNQAQGLFHIGQRDINWIRVSRAARNSGLKLHHMGVIIHARLHEDFGNILDKVQVTISTEQGNVEELLKTARKTYQERDERIAGLTDEAVEEFYSCTLCQSFAPNHVCIVKPERLGLCGAYNWLDCKVSHEINPIGPNQPVRKGNVLDPERGEWEGVNNAVRERSKRRIERFHAYSCMTYPETSCGCFECIIAFVPEVNGFMAVHRQYQGMTPAGMTFTTLAGSIGGGQQTPGFIGIGRLYLLSQKFLRADGGIKRIVWLNRELKEYLGERFKKRCEEEGIPALADMIADENIATNPEELLDFLRAVKHPVLTMSPLLR
jgi:acetyl-CoA synthase